MKKSGKSNRQLAKQGIRNYLGTFYTCLSTTSPYLLWILFLFNQVSQFVVRCSFISPFFPFPSILINNAGNKLSLGGKKGEKGKNSWKKIPRLIKSTTWEGKEGEKSTGECVGKQ
jgi:hypothetical protein